ncbi:zinc finger Y-chromosomal protein 1 [Colletotrichum spaethianum]|uniref:Zinc finger Y-chromosomal protein 1 n=1 Tax=Colletotrichum spaethianum TaxID=700344 RepID=A0AA37L859_9PEZI|nr:zinc finger Y-chromosomal protein 1 [Colletotrichum spaethianum]GKT41895.1 zinc finger Y-chromosomal protein 1 [Colletotrichum spaethianum]
MSVSVNPRRRTPVTRPESPAGSGLTLKTNSLRKGATFHSPTSPTSSQDDALTAPPSLRRSQTNLDDVVDAHCRRMALIVDDIDKSLANINLVSPKAKSFRDDSLPVPRGFLNLPVVDPAMAKEKSKETERRILRPRTRRSSRHHESDSGLGTSVAPTTETESATTASKKASAITRSAANTSSSTMEKLPALSSKAVNRIHEHVLRPLRAKPALKDFESIVLDVPRRIRDKEIICLRDLEKTLIFMAPVSQLLNETGVWGNTYRSLMKERTKTAALYLDFCLTSIRCIQATVEYLSDREQTRPNDRPYTNGYFIDLVEQIRQYAGQLAAAKETGTDAAEMDVDPTDEIKLFGGITENGRPAELVRVRKDGKAISMATGLEVDLDDAKSPIQMKRSLSQQLEDDEEIMRSMARRKKNASPEELAPRSAASPAATRSSSALATSPSTRRLTLVPGNAPSSRANTMSMEMDRHHNDKHSSAPPMYECLYKPCPYKSKRESNCKQHMEKAHGWQYVRTKTNGKKPSSKAGSVTHSTPQLIHMPTPSTSSAATPPPPIDQAQFNFNDPILAPLHAIGPVGDFASHIDGMEFPSYISDEEFDQVLGVSGPFDGQLDMSMSPSDHNTPSTDVSYGPYSYQEGPDFTVNEDIYGAHAQLPTPDRAVFAEKMNIAFPIYQSVSACQPQLDTVQTAPHISPIGQGNAMLYTPNSLADVDEGFEDTFTGGGNEFCGNDFQLFPANNMSKTYEPLFGEMPSAGLGYSQTSQDPFQSLDWNMDYQNFQNQ